jgi:methylated-DNA-[protein]-cysteine S-methyltransferase|tara:strand:+ start:780 stop:1256 length:477 start_codon:yes stop_codon:yes gene_type:complete
MYTDFLDSPLGVIEIQGTKCEIVKVLFGKNKRCALSNSLVLECKKQLIEYFSGKRTEFTLPLNTQGTSFQTLIWNEIQNIDFGLCATYADIANLVRTPKGARAVGNALNKNPINIIIPCHRIIRKDGKSINYSGGLRKKFWLIDHEARIKKYQTEDML